MSNNLDRDNSCHNVKVDTPALAGCVPQLDRASEVLPEAVADSIGSSDPSNPVKVWDFECIDEDENVISKWSLNVMSLYPLAVQTCLNRMVDDINNHPSSLAGKAFRVRANELNKVG